MTLMEKIKSVLRRPAFPRSFALPAPKPDPQDRIAVLLSKASDDSVHRQEFYRTLLNSSLFVVGHISGLHPVNLDGTVTSRYGDRLELIQIELNGILHVPFFSSESHLAQAGFGGQPFTGMRGRALFSLIPPETPAVLNIGSQNGKFFFPDEISSLAVGEIPEFTTSQHVELDEGTELVLGAPSREHRELQAALHGAAGHYPKIQRLFISRLESSRDDEASNLTLIVDSDDRLSAAEWNDFSNEVESLRQSYLPWESELEIVPVVPGGIIADLVDSGAVQPFFSRV